ncbi:MAG TPA: chemotaxis-specific protein-glutamate methyltransferase CheB [Polyangiaceae bacterium]
MPKIRALVVDDSVTVRHRLVEVLGADPEIEVVGEAGDGKSAIERCTRLRPDVVTLDMMLPVMTGQEVTEYVMAHSPTPILIVSSSTNRGELFKTYEALAAGAVDVLEKPRGDERDGEWERSFCAAVKMVSRIHVITHVRGRLGALGRARPSVPPEDLRPRLAGALEIAVVGASTGGPAALIALLGAIPAGFPLPIVIVLHLDEVFGSAFAEWLDGQTRHRVAYPADGEPVASFAGRVALAPPGRHLTIAGGRFHISSEPPRHSCRPSVDVLFESIAREYGPSAVACLLTGMGKDGAAGLLAIRRAGGTTVAQDEATCAVYGMPREAVLLGAAERVLPLDAIGPTLAALAGVRAGG